MLPMVTSYGGGVIVSVGSVGVVNSCSCACRLPVVDHVVVVIGLSVVGHAIVF